MFQPNSVHYPGIAGQERIVLADKAGWRPSLLAPRPGIKYYRFF
jgi:hypothetical protein